MVASITIGAGRNRPQGVRVQVDPGADALASALARIAEAVDAWWSPHVWAGDYRNQSEWQGASCIAVDIDYYNSLGKHAALPAEVDDILRVAAFAGEVPGNLFHLTPRGARIVFCLREPVTDIKRFHCISAGAGRAISDALVTIGVAGAKPDKAGLILDDAVLEDTARFLFAPKAIVDGIHRNADVSVMRRDLTPLTMLESLGRSAMAPPPIPAARMQIRPTKPARSTAPSMDEAIAAFNSSHAEEWPTSGSGQCPICQHNGCFGRMADTQNRWACFSSQHTDGKGIKGKGIYHGDALDIAANAAGIGRIELLRREGYVAAAPVPSHREDPPITEPPGWLDLGDEPGQMTADGATVTPITQPKPRNLRSRSYLSCVTIFRRDNLRKQIMGEQRIGLNEMSGEITIIASNGTRRPIRDVDYDMFRAEIELVFQGDADKGGMSFSREDVFSSIAQEAYANPFHPIRDYLNALEWDGTPRWRGGLLDAMGIATGNALDGTLLTKWGISAVARALKPGEKVDTALILAGPQGAGKSSFFRMMAGDDWFAESDMDVSDKESFMVLQRAWIVEWAELEAMQRARDQSTVKQFLSKTHDVFVPKYGRSVVTQPRTAVIVGTTNEARFLADPTGARRYWPICVKTIDLTWVRANRDQLWAEAVASYMEGKSWHLDNLERAELADRHGDYTEGDLWDEPIAAWIAGRTGFTTEQLAGEALRLELDKQDARCQKRICAVLRRFGWERRRVAFDGERRYRWCRMEAE